MKIYWGSGSPFCWQVLLAAHHKGITFESCRLDLGKKEHRTSELMTANPRGTVPFLIGEAGTVTGSLPIMAYLDRLEPTSPLFGTDAAETARIWHEFEQQRTDVHDAATAIIRPIFRNKIDAQRDVLTEAIPVIHRELDRVEGLLQESAWLCGDTLSAADIVLLPTLERLLRAAGKDAVRELSLNLLPLSERYPSLHRWHESFAALPYFDECYPPHWRTK